MKSKVITELKRIAAENDGILQPETVVDEARPVSSPLHSRFEWDNSVAGQAYRIWQARQLIRVVVEVLPGTDELSEVFVSLTPDRKGGGYRIMADVLSHEDSRKQLLRDAMKDLELFRDKYRRLKELTEVFRAIRKIRGRSRSRPNK